MVAFFLMDTVRMSITKANHDSLFMAGRFLYSELQIFRI
jgi:hypothetical protein